MSPNSRKINHSLKLFLTIIIIIINMALITENKPFFFAFIEMKFIKRRNKKYLLKLTLTIPGIHIEERRFGGFDTYSTYLKQEKQKGATSKMPNKWMIKQKLGGIGRRREPRMDTAHKRKKS